MRYYTVAEYAALTGKSRQSIYKRLKTTLQPFVKRDGDTIYISEESLKNDKIQANTPPSLSTLETTPETTVDNPGDNPTETPSELHRIIATQAEQIADLTGQIKDLQAAILSQNQQITELLSKSLQLQDQLHKIIVIPQLQQAQARADLSTVDNPTVNPGDNPTVNHGDNPIVNPGDNPTDRRKKETPHSPITAILRRFKKR